MSKLGFQIEEWTHLKQLYGENVFENEFLVEYVYFQKWINPSKVMGYRINFIVILKMKPSYILKKWGNVTQVRIYLKFDGDFGLKLFNLKNRRLLGLKGKYIKFIFNQDKLYEHNKIRITYENQELTFYAKNFFSRVYPA